jgi:hypothetical protein
LPGDAKAAASGASAAPVARAVSVPPETAEIVFIKPEESAPQTSPPPPERLDDVRGAGPSPAGAGSPSMPVAPAATQAARVGAPAALGQAMIERGKSPWPWLLLGAAIATTVVLLLRAFVS